MLKTDLYSALENISWHPFLKHWILTAIPLLLARGSGVPRPPRWFPSFFCDRFDPVYSGSLKRQSRFLGNSVA